MNNPPPLHREEAFPYTKLIDSIFDQTVIAEYIKDSSELNHLLGKNKDYESSFPFSKIQHRPLLWNLTFAFAIAAHFQAERKPDYDHKNFTNSVFNRALKTYNYNVILENYVKAPKELKAVKKSLKQTLFFKQDQSINLAKLTKILFSFKLEAMSLIYNSAEENFYPYPVATRIRKESFGLSICVLVSHLGYAFDETEEMDRLNILSELIGDTISEFRKILGYPAMN